MLSDNWVHVKSVGLFLLAVLLLSTLLLLMVWMALPSEMLCLEILWGIVQVCSSEGMCLVLLHALVQKHRKLKSTSWVPFFFFLVSHKVICTSTTNLSEGCLFAISQTHFCFIFSPWFWVIAFLLVSQGACRRWGREKGLLLAFSNLEETISYSLCGWSECFPLLPPSPLTELVPKLELWVSTDAPSGQILLFVQFPWPGFHSQSHFSVVTPQDVVWSP